MIVRHKKPKPNLKTLTIARICKGWNLKQLAVESNQDYGKVRDLMRGKACAPEVVLGVCRALELSPQMIWK